MIWLIGNQGMLGKELSDVLSKNNIEFTGTDCEIDITSFKALEAFTHGKKIEWIINCAAYTAVDKAEDEIELCTLLNVQGPENIARIAKKTGASLIHISTDYVFDGRATSPYSETDTLNPTGIYGKTKAEGEEKIRSVLDNHIIIRTAWLYGKHGQNFVYTMLRLMKEKESLGVVGDQYGSPTWTGDLAELIKRILTEPKIQYGTYHFTNENSCSWYEFALEIQDLGLKYDLLEKKIPIKNLTTSEYPTKAKRPAYSVLSKEKAKNTFSLIIPTWKESLENFIKEITNDK